MHYKSIQQALIDDLICQISEAKALNDEESLFIVKEELRLTLEAIKDLDSEIYEKYFSMLDK